MGMQPLKELMEYLVSTKVSVDFGCSYCFLILQIYTDYQFELVFRVLSTAVYSHHQSFQHGAGAFQKKLTSNFKAENKCPDIEEDVLEEFIEPRRQNLGNQPKTLFASWKYVPPQKITDTPIFLKKRVTHCFACAKGDTRLKETALNITFKTIPLSFSNVLLLMNTPFCRK